MVSNPGEVDMMFCNKWRKKFPRHEDFSTKHNKVIAHKHRNKNKVGWKKLWFWLSVRNFLFLHLGLKIVSGCKVVRSGKEPTKVRARWLEKAKNAFSARASIRSFFLLVGNCFFFKETRVNLFFSHLFLKIR